MLVEILILGQPMDIPIHQGLSNGTEFYVPFNLKMIYSLGQHIVSCEDALVITWICYSVCKIK